ncbi:calcium-transporting ATPase 8, plasma membrane-type [Arabidopsis lyrata subsp. lyrata]|uniref:calcium-transporting ATPase 8, plasma membrane-type n=1 Tax=Arabidopsis lyrata subsp. lyrata TaxID=81972 RepID=UPI000A29BCD1|nr:calcium-transporting ATPase 8, plasma membrane-type [Arabidopsis lyrata subsp. lyrata]|eukprot:XP_020871438.1 calcium-transporting ATPase 8, plasma membrane-type [Arabidopsis lyrata subsp. lyrata]
MCKRVPEDLEVGLAEDASENVIQDSDSEAVVVEITPEDLEMGVVSNNERTSMLIAWFWTVLILPVTTLKKAFCLEKFQTQTEPKFPIIFCCESGNSPACEFDIGLEELVQLVRDRSLEALNRYNGVIGLSNLLKTNLKVGIDDDDDEILHRRQTFGSNTYPCKKGKSLSRFIWKASQFPPSLLITLAAVIQSLLRIRRKAIDDGWYEEPCVVLLIILDIIVRASTEYWQSLQFEKLTKEKRNVHLYVTRGGGSVWVSIYDIVVGDIVPLRNGGQVPADGVLFHANSLKIDEQEITGPHDIVQKDLQIDPFLLSGSKLIEGIGTMLVTSVGMNTEWGQMMEIAHDTDEEKPFQVYLKWIANSASCLVVLFALVACIVQLCRYFYGRTKTSDGNPMFILGITTAKEATEFVIKSLSFGIATIIVGVPVGLPIAVLLNFANTARKMMTDSALVQTPSACERMGHVTTILCHKTGVLTLNKMSVVDVWAGEIRMQDMDNGSQLPTLLKELIIEGIAQNTNGSVVLETGVSPTEQAILSFGNKLGMKFDDVRSASLGRHTIPFNPDKKYGGVALKLSTRALVHWKGSAKIILNSCEKYMDGSDNPIAIDEQKRKGFEETIKYMCERGLRCAALAYQPYELEKLPSNEALSRLPSLPGKLVLLAIIGIEDPCRPGTKEEIQLCQSGGVKVRMVTDDDILTATAIAKKCGIFDEASDGNILTGAEFRNLSDLEREERVEDLLVLAESSPSENLLFVKALKKRQHVVAATGMGIHDSETLMAADVGLAMGIGGTAAAKEKSDIIILDGEFATIIKVILWCRYLYTNIQRCVLFRLTVSVSVVAICVAEVVIHNAFPLNTVQLLLLNLTIDIFGALALAYRPPAHHLMGKPPVNIRDPLINTTMWNKLVIQVIHQVLSLALVHSEKILELKHGPTGNAVKVMNTLIFNSFVFCMAFNNDFEIRSLDQTFKEIFRENMFLVTITSTIIFQIFVLKLLGLFNSSVKLDLKEWLVASVLGLLSQLATHFPLQAHQYNRN